MIEAFVWQRRVGFGDCDPALIAYTGRIADFALEALDAFWDDLLDGRGWYHMNVHQGYGMPFVRMEYEFAAPITTSITVARFFEGVRALLRLDEPFATSTKR
ncbi:hypothetical protein [Paracoccus sp. pheM1]|uniref:hypothetical protein n=1 Tax=Paracoccus sp. pheM1 TaxID=2831675 RepID=UPI001BDB8B08|nr:hypothetical protein [Paracoccus sp. pheM1]MBT0779292.1 hypothetical protein [Paracoccus sp. pheM1]